jgi:protein-tyrosine phosphatase
MANTTAQGLQDEVLNTIRKSQETVIDALKTWAETIQSITPKLPSVPVPGADKLPKPEELVASAYDFAEQLLAGQRKFAEEVVKATVSLMPGTEDTTK